MNKNRSRECLISRDLDCDREVCLLCLALGGLELETLGLGRIG